MRRDLGTGAVVVDVLVDVEVVGLEVALRRMEGRFLGAVGACGVLVWGFAGEVWIITMIGLVIRYSCCLKRNARRGGMLWLLWLLFGRFEEELDS